MLYLTDLASSLLGLITEEIVSRFDSDPKLRYELISLAKSYSAYPLTEWEIDEMFPSGEINRMMSKIYHRERAISYLEFFQMARSTLSAELKVITNLEEVFTEYSREDLRSEWLLAHGFRPKVDNLICQLEESVRWFNIQVVSLLLQRILSRGWNFSLCKERGITPDSDEILAEATAVADLGYCNGSREFNQLGEPYQAMISAGTPELARFFELTSEQGESIFRARMYGSGDLDLSPFQEEDEVEEQPQYIQTASGLIIPRQRVNDVRGES